MARKKRFPKISVTVDDSAFPVPTAKEILEAGPKHGWTDAEEIERRKLIAKKTIEAQTL